jgi:hypothetical protein
MVADPDQHCLFIWIRIVFLKLDPDQHWSEKLDPDPHWSESWIRLRIGVTSWIRVRIKVTTQEF